MTKFIFREPISGREVFRDERSEEPEEVAFIEQENRDYEEPVIEQIDEYPLFTEDSFSEETMEEYVFNDDDYEDDM